MTQDEIYHQLTAIFRSVLGEDGIKLTAATTADDIEAWDSMNHIFLLVEIERRFHVKFQAAEMEELKNVGELVSLLQAKLRSNA